LVGGVATAAQHWADPSTSSVWARLLQHMDAARRCA